MFGKFDAQNTLKQLFLEDVFHWRKDVKDVIQWRTLSDYKMFRRAWCYSRDIHKKVQQNLWFLYSYACLLPYATDCCQNHMIHPRTYKEIFIKIWSVTYARKIFPKIEDRKTFPRSKDLYFGVFSETSQGTFFVCWATHIIQILNFEYECFCNSICLARLYTFSVTWYSSKVCLRIDNTLCLLWDFGLSVSRIIIY